MAAVAARPQLAGRPRSCRKNCKRQVQASARKKRRGPRSRRCAPPPSSSSSSSTASAVQIVSYDDGVDEDALVDIPRRRGGRRRVLPAETGSSPSRSAPTAMLERTRGSQPSRPRAPTAS